MGVCVCVCVCVCMCVCVGGGEGGGGENHVGSKFMSFKVTDCLRHSNIDNIACKNICQ